MSDLIITNCSEKDTIPSFPKRSNFIMETFQSFHDGFLTPFFALLIFQVYRTNLFSFIKLPRIIIQVLLVIIERLIIRCIEGNRVLAPYYINETVESTTTQIFFAHSKLTGIEICMKVWPKRKVGNNELENPTAQLRNLLEGFRFNRRFGPGVYLGIAPVLRQGEGVQKILRGGLIFNPSINNLKPGEYVIVMRNIQKKWKLDYLLSLKRNNLRTRKGMKFLAKQVARLHKKLEPSPQEKSRHDVVASKLAFNMQRLGQAIQMPGNENMEEQFNYICRVITAAYSNYESYFEQRCRDGYIKRCHGDLKTTNLWITPRRILPRKLFALDCIDFNSDFCHIDTLSDLAMLAVNIQQVMRKSDENEAEELTKHFLEAYCQEMRENYVSIQPLLLYYMTEKAMVCSYVSILLDDSPELGGEYFAIAFLLAQQLEQLLVPVFHPEQGLPMLIR